MYVKTEILMGDLKSLYSLCWDGAINTLNQVQEEGKTTDFIFLLEERFWDKEPTVYELNEFIWFDVPEILNLYEED